MSHKHRYKKAFMAKTLICFVTDHGSVKCITIHKHRYKEAFMAEILIYKKKNSHLMGVKTSSGRVAPMPMLHEMSIQRHKVSLNGLAFLLFRRCLVVSYFQL
jgi:hypothetical protein